MNNLEAKNPAVKFTISHLNARQLGNGAIFIQYDLNGRAMDAALLTWEDFVTWLKENLCLKQP